MGIDRLLVLVNKAIPRLCEHQRLVKPSAEGYQYVDPVVTGLCWPKCDKCGSALCRERID